MKCTPVSIAFKNRQSASMHGLLIYSIKDDQHQYTGILSGLSIDQIQSNVFPHENTIPQKVQFQKEKILKNGALGKPILLCFKANQGIRNYLLEYIDQHKPTIDTYLDKYQSRHRIWNVSDPSFLIQAMEELSAMYVVDGHHRRDALIALSKEHSIASGLIAAFDEDNLVVKAFHRIIELPIRLSTDDLINQLNVYGSIEEVEYLETPTEAHHLSIVLDGRLLSFKWDSTIINATKHDFIQRMDVNLLTKYVFHKTLGFSQSDIDQKVSYTEGTRSISQIIANNQDQRKMVVFLPPLTTNSFIEAADMGITLPPKSTFILPRMPSGLFEMKI